MLPELLSIGNISLYSYPLLMGVAWGVAYAVSCTLLRSYNVNANFNEIFVGVFASSWIGAKIFFLLFSAKEYSIAGASSFWLGGGFVFYGGLIFALAFLLIYGFALKRFQLRNAHLFLPGLAFGHAIGRVGCFLAGCCYGSKTGCLLAVVMHRHPRHPVQLYEALFAAALGWFLLLQIRNRRNYLSVIFTYLVGYSSIRFLLEFIRGDDVRGVMEVGLSVSQLISILIFIASFVILIVLKNERFK